MINQISQKTNAPGPAGFSAKGKGVALVEDKNDRHGKSLSRTQAQEALEQLDDTTSRTTPPRGGIGETVASAVAGSACPVHMLAVQQVPRSGTPEELLAFEGIDRHAVVNTEQALLSWS